MYKFVILAAFSLLFSTDAFSQINCSNQANCPVRIYPDNHGALKPQTLYAIELRCAPGPQPFPSAASAGLFPTVAKTLSHAVVVSTANVSGAVTIASLPSSAVAVIAPYSVNTAPDAANEINNLTQGCEANYLVKGPASLYLTALYGESSTPIPGTLADALKSVASIATSLAPVVTGASLAVNVGKTLSGVNGAAQPLESLFQDLFPKSGRTYQATFPLTVGATSVATQFSTVSVVVRPIDSIVFDDINPDKPYFNDFTKTIDSLSFDATSSGKSCSAIRRSLILAGFTSPDDEAYALGRVAIKNNLSNKASVAECLGYSLCQSALATKMDAVLWAGNTDLKPRADDCDGLKVDTDSAPAQPPYTEIYPTVRDLSQFYGQYNAGDPVPQRLQEFMSKRFSNPVKIDDRTAYTLFGDTKTEDPQVLITFLKTKGFLRLGCYSPTSDPEASYGSRASIVSAKIDKVGATAPIDDAIALFPLWKDGTISRIIVSGDQQDISASIGNRTSCGGFVVSK
jgi:hypothetical protein